MLVISAHSHFLFITEDNIVSLSDDFNEAAPHKLTTKFPSMCKHMPANCQPFLLSLANDSVLLIPSVDLVKYFKLTNSSLIFLNELSVKHCFRYFPTGKGNNELYALCLKYHTDEMTTVTYKIRYTDDFRLTVSQYGYGYGTHVDINSSLVVTFSDSSDPIVLYIANGGSEDMLYIKDLNAGGDVCDHMSLPSDCTGPYELSHLYHRIALLKCSNGLGYLYDSYTSEFIKLLVQGITMIKRCANSSFFVVITTQGNILLNKTASDSLIRIPFFKVTVNSFQLDAISSFACHWNGTATVLYFTVLQDDDMMYYMYIPLEHVAKLKSYTEAHQMLKVPTHGLSYILQSSIVGSAAWVTKLTDEDNNIQETVLINIRTKTSGSHSSNGLPYVLSYQNNSFHSNTIKVKEVTESDSETYNSKRLPRFIIGIFASIAVIVLVIVAIIIVYCKRQGKRERPTLYLTLYSRILKRNGEELAAEEHDTSFNDEDEVENPELTSQTVGHHSDVLDENNSQTNEEAAAPPANQDLPTAADNPDIANPCPHTGNNRFNYNSVPSEFTPTEEATSQTITSSGQVTGALNEVVGEDETRAQATVDGQGSDDECSDP